MLIATMILIITPAVALAHDGSELTIGTGVSIIALAFVTYIRYKTYRERPMSEKINLAVDMKQAAAMLAGGTSLTLTFTNVVSLVGLIISVIGAVFIFLNWQINRDNNRINKQNADERKRANDLKERELRQAGVNFEDDPQ